jgi:hypothetical protein
MILGCLQKGDTILEKNIETTIGNCCDSLEDEKLQINLRGLVKNRCEVESDQDAICNELLEKYVREFCENDFDQCYETVIQIRNAACFLGYKLASKDISNILEI